MKVQIVLFTDLTRSDYVRSIGAYRLATELRKSSFTVQVIDHFNWLSNDQIALLLEKFLNEKTLLIGFSSTFCTISDEKVEYIKVIAKKISPNIKLILGGPQADLLQQKNIDIFIKGYADTTIVTLANELLKQKSIKSTKVMSLDGKIKNVIDWDTKAETFDFQNSSTIFLENDFVQPGEVLPIEISRGCIFKCKFCAYPLNGKKKNTYIKHPEVLYNELMTNYNKHKTTHYIFSDDTHNESIEKLEILYNEVFSKLPFKINYWAYIRHDLIYTYKDMADILLKSGLRTATFGLETLNAKTAKIIGKGLSPEKSVELLYWLREKWGKQVGTGSGFILGLPEETEKTLSNWTTKLINNDFPLDSIFIHPLFLSKTPRTFSSEFETNSSKYGYSFPRLDDTTFWQNQYLNRDNVLSFAKSLKQLAGRRNTVAGGFFPYGLMNLGIDFEKSRYLTLSTIKSLPIKNMRQQLVDKYFLQLMSI